MRRHAFRRATGWTAVVCALLVLAGAPASGDDTQLFRSEAGKPYVFVIVDTSTSMNVAPKTNAFVPASGDDPGSKFRQIKEALVEVFGEVYRQNGDTIHFGFAGFNQDRAKVRGKHWLYRVDSIENPLPIDYPRVGDVLTFGKHFELGGTTVNGVAGSCNDLSNPALQLSDRTKLHRFAKLNPRDTNDDGDADAYDTTTMWVREGTAPTSPLYRLEFSRLEGDFGGPLKVRLELRRKNSSDICPNAGVLGEAIVNLSYVTEFLMSDEGTGTTNTSAQLAHCTGNEKTERTAGVGWTWQDISAIDTCGGKRPHSGNGWEGNYDGLPLPVGPSFSAADNVDPVCSTCPYSVKFGNELAADRVLDKGDMLPFHWSDTHRLEFFRRMAPNWDESKTFEELEFRAAAYYRDVPRAGRDYLELRDEDQRPLLPFGASPVGGAITDFRCWYLGIGDQKCKVENVPYGFGWDDYAKTRDFEFGCRKPFLILVGDGEAHGNANDPTSSVSDFKKDGLGRVWAIDYGGDCAKNSTYHSLTNAAGAGECVAPDNPAALKDALRKIIGVIIEQTKSFSSAAVPTVQADVADRVFLSNFTPLNDAVAPAWPGRMNAFLKPVPLTTDGKPDTSNAALCPTSEPACVPVAPGSPDPCPTNSRCTPTKLGNRCVATGCFLWDAGTQLLTQYQADASSQNGTGEQQRRVYYAEMAPSGEWPEGRHFFKPRTNSTDPQAMRFDFWRGFRLSFLPIEVDATTNKTAQDTANEIVRETLQRKLADLNSPETTTTSDDTPFLLGDIFHSTPVVVGGPVNTLYFATNVAGYRDFALKHQRRRKILLVGANDGMLHAFDAGRYQTSTERFTNGTGKEVFAYIPRPAMPTLRELYAGSGENRTWTVDGTVNVADVRIDPLFDGTADPEGSDGPEWRTVAVGALREGGVGYFALDITQPDTLTSGVPVPGAGGFVPSCMGDENNNVSGACGPVPYPSPLWEFTDGIYVPLLGRALPLDEDGNGAADLAPGWSTPNIGRIRVVDLDGEEVDRHVAVFGGGLNKTELAGNWLYMLDMETGKAIYKHRVLGSVPSEPSAVDTDQDGYLDSIYFGTTRGYLYRIDLRRANGSLPRLEEVEVAATSGSVTYEETLGRIIEPDFAPRVIFKAQPTPDIAAVPPRPIYYRASVIYVAKLNRYAVAFGTGDRENLFNFDGQTGRFYVFRDDVAVDDRTTFYTEADLQAVAPTDAARSEDFLSDLAASKRGWFLTLNADERLITNPFALSGILVFTAFTPNPTPPPTDPRPRDTLFCRRDGTSRIFGVTADNANALLIDTNGNASRFVTLGDFVTDPYTEQGATKNPTVSRQNADQFPAGSHLAEVMEKLKSLFPSNCRFSSYRIDVKTLSSDTGVVFIAPVPICIIEKDWREF